MDQATANNVFQMDKFERLLGSLEDSGEFSDREELDEGVSQIMAEMQRAREAGSVGVGLEQLDQSLGHRNGQVTPTCPALPATFGKPRARISANDIQLPAGLRPAGSQACHSVNASRRAWIVCLRRTLMAKIDLSGQVWSQFEQSKVRAERLLEAGQAAEAAAAYRRCADLLRQYGSTQSPTTSASSGTERAGKFDEMAARIESGQLARATTEPAAGEDYREAVRGLITKTDIAWDDIGGLEETKREIQTAYALAVARKPKGVSLSAARNILLYGPPGTGKTLLAAATSHELDADLLQRQGQRHAQQVLRRIVQAGQRTLRRSGRPGAQRHLPGRVRRADRQPRGQRQRRGAAGALHPALRAGRPGQTSAATTAPTSSPSPPPTCPGRSTRRC